MLVAAAAVLAVEAAALAAYTVYNVIDLATSHSRTAANGAALIVIQLIILVGLLLMARGVLRLRPWTRTPSVMAQVLVGVVGYILLEARQYPWGAIALVLAVAGLVGFLTPASLKALARPMPGEADTPPNPAGKSGKTAKTGKPASRR